MPEGDSEITSQPVGPRRTQRVRTFSQWPGLHAHPHRRPTAPRILMLLFERFSSDHPGGEDQRHRLDGEVAALDEPFVILLGEERAGEADHGILPSSFLAGPSDCDTLAHPSSDVKRTANPGFDLPGILDDPLGPARNASAGTLIRAEPRDGEGGYHRLSHRPDPACEAGARRDCISSRARDGRAIAKVTKRGPRPRRACLLVGG